LLSGGTPSTKNSSYWGDEIPWITPRDLSSFKDVFIEKGERSISIEGLENSSAKLLPKNTILFSSRAPIGYVVIAQNEAATNQGFKNLICDEVNSHFKYFYYLMKYKADFIERLSSGSTFSEASGTLIKSIELYLPPLPEQKAIANVLTAFDDKIELLQAQNKTLETMAQTIFKEWFGKYQIGDELPEGWRVGKLGDVIDIFDSKRVPLSKPQRESMSGDYRYYGATKVMDYVNDYLFDGIYLLFAEDGSVMDENGHPFLQYVWGKFWVNNHTHILKGKNGFSTELLYVLCKKMKVAGIVNGAVQLKINQGNLLSKEIILPTDFILDKVDKIIQPLFNKLRINSSQIQSLTKTRDTLLPKLMSGQVRVNNIKQSAYA
jgi:type I restriction enzyme, S subunit